MDRDEAMADMWHALVSLVDSRCTSCSACAESRAALDRAERELVAARALAASERARCERYERINVALTEDALAAREERAVDLADAEARAAKHKSALSSLREELGKVADAVQAVAATVAAPRSKELAQLAKRAAKRAAGSECARLWSLTAELASLVSDSRANAVESARAELESARRELASHGPAYPTKLKQIAEHALNELKESRAECERARLSELKSQSLYAAVSGEYKRIMHTTRVTVKIASMDAANLTDAERGAVRVALDLLMAPEVDPTGTVAMLMHAVCPVEAVAVMHARRCTEALVELVSDCRAPRARSAFLEAVYAHASEIGGDVARRAVACDSVANDPMLEAVRRANTTPIAQYDVAAQPHELVRALVIVRLVTSVRPISHSDAALARPFAN